MCVCGCVCVVCVWLSSTVLKLIGMRASGRCIPWLFGALFAALGHGCATRGGCGVLWPGARSDSGSGRRPHGPGQLWGLDGSGLWRCLGTSGCGGGWWRSGASWSPWRQGLQCGPGSPDWGDDPLDWAAAVAESVQAPMQEVPLSLSPDGGIADVPTNGSGAVLVGPTHSDRVRETVATRHLSICAAIKDQALAPPSWRRMRLPLRVEGIDQALMVAWRTLSSVPLLPRWASLAPSSAALARGSAEARSGSPNKRHKGSGGHDRGPGTAVLIFVAHHSSPWSDRFWQQTKEQGQAYLQALECGGSGSL